MREIPSLITERSCPCGARRNKSSKLCRKCSAGVRWHRRRAWRGRKTPALYRTGKK